MLIAAHQDDRVRPGRSEARHNATQVGDRFRSTGAVPWAQDGGNQFAAEAFIHMERLIAPVAIIAIEQRELLLPVDGAIGVIEIQHNHLRRRGIRLEENVDKSGGHPIELRPAGGIFQPGHGGLTGQRGLAIRDLVHGQLKRRIGAERVTIIGIGIAAGDLVHPLGQQGLLGMRGVRRMPGIDQAVGESSNDPHLGFGLPKQEDPGIRGEVPTLIVDQERLALDRGQCQRKIRLVFAKRGRYILHNRVPEWL